MIEKGWGATMVLTEPDAGSDVGAGRTKAVPQEDGSWHLEASAVDHLGRDQDLTEASCISCWPGPRRPGAHAQARHQGPVALPRPRVPLHPETARRRAHGVFVTKTSSTRWVSMRRHVEPRSASTACPPSLVARRGARRRRPDVPGDRVRRTMVARRRSAPRRRATSPRWGSPRSACRVPISADALQTAPRVTITHHPDVRPASTWRRRTRGAGRCTHTRRPGRTRSALPRGRGRGSRHCLCGWNDLLLSIVKGVGSERAKVSKLVQSLQILVRIGRS